MFAVSAIAWLLIFMPPDPVAELFQSAPRRGNQNLRPVRRPQILSMNSSQQLSEFDQQVAGRAY
jgi:hypothetical protein